MVVKKSRAHEFALLPPKERRAFLQSLTTEELQALQYDWRFWARPDQLPPPGDWFVWMIMAGRGAGKTRTGAEWIRHIVNTGKYERIALVAEDAGDARDVMVEGESGIMSVFPPHERPVFNGSLRRVTFHNGAIATTYSAVDAEALRGPQHHAAWVDELAKFKRASEVWDQLQFGLRLGQNPRIVVTTTPKPIKLLRDIIDRPDTILTTATTHDNLHNLSPTFRSTVLDRYAGTRLGRQEIMGELIFDNPNALFTEKTFEAYRLEKAPSLDRIVVAVDPPVSSDDDSDECGIIVAGEASQDGKKHYYVLADMSVQGRSPMGWASQVIKAYHAFEADVIAAEINQGGDMVESVIRQVDDRPRIVKVRATRGKWLRAEPVAGLYEQGRVHHVGRFQELEAQMEDFDPSGMSSGKSPDRLDALVWAITHLITGGDSDVGIDIL